MDELEKEKKRKEKERMDELEKNLFDGAKRGDQKLVEKVLQKKEEEEIIIDINSFKDKNGESPLHIAVGNGFEKVVNILIEHGASVNLQNDDGDSPLHIAVEKGFEKVVEILVKRADVDLQNERGKTPLCCVGFEVSSSIQIMEILLENGANVNATDYDEISPILNAAKEGTEEQVKFLVKNGANVHFCGEGRSLVHYAGKRGKIEMLKFLIASGAPVDNQDDEGNSPLLEAVRAGEKEVMEILVECGADVDFQYEYHYKTGFSPLHDLDDLEIRKFLVEHGAYVDVETADGNLPLHRGAIAGEEEFVKILVDHGTDIDHQNRNGETALHCAAEGNQIEIVKFLLEHEADVDLQTKWDGMTALHLAAWNGFAMVVKLLVEHNANLNIQNKDGNTASEIAKEQPIVDLINILRGKNIKPAKKKRKVNPEE